ncbi:uncharacterized protein N7459_003021 [Penicillium hispanicum]|uniref:uncharacterized protein n=1 Tax=Penicillium hispanicum TaxID=1080232 RepID=UPI00253FE701|nr:uncharacterized protein N7459_003021 [Penicillium hispanicum]KAJ5587256.1 hypothetical protein N7459_003021 [Penicillium hispanicum]
MLFHDDAIVLKDTFARPLWDFRSEDLKSEEIDPGFDIYDAGGLGPAPSSGVEGSPKHEFGLVDLGVAVDETVYKLFLDIVIRKLTSKLLMVNLLHFELVSVMKEKIVTDPAQ